eukprot:7381652-Prymnesium_polylepis.1
MSANDCHAGSTCTVLFVGTPEPTGDNAPEPTGDNAQARLSRGSSRTSVKPEITELRCKLAWVRDAARATACVPCGACRPRSSRRTACSAAAAVRGAGWPCGLAALSCRKQTRVLRVRDPRAACEGPVCVRCGPACGWHRCALRALRPPYPAAGGGQLGVRDRYEEPERQARVDQNDAARNAFAWRVESARPCLCARAAAAACAVHGPLTTHQSLTTHLSRLSLRWADAVHGEREGAAAADDGDQPGARRKRHCLTHDHKRASLVRWHRSAKGEPGARRKHW